MFKNKKLLKFIFLVFMFSILMKIVLASSDCQFKIEGKEASLLDDCTIKTVKDNILAITFFECKKIKVEGYDFTLNDDDKLILNLSAPGDHTINNQLIYNDNFISYTSWLKSVTHIPYVTCDNAYSKYKLRIKVYPLENPVREFNSAPKSESKSDTKTTVINNYVYGDNAQVTTVTGDSNKITQTSSNVNFIKDFIKEFYIQIITTIIVTPISIIIEHYILLHLKRKRNAKSKRKK